MKHQAMQITSDIDNKLLIPDLIGIINTFTEELQSTSIYGRFKSVPLHSKFSKHEFYGFRGTLNSFSVYLAFYKKEENYYFLNKSYESKVTFTPNTLYETLKDYFENLLEEHQFNILLDPPVVELSSFISLLPLENKFKSEKELMKMLVSKGYHYNEIEEYCIELKKEHEKQLKITGDSYYLKNNLSPLYFSINNNNEIGYGCGRMTGTHCYIKFKNNYVLLTDEDDKSEKPAYIIFDSKRDMRTWALRNRNLSK